MSTELVMPSNHLVLCRPRLLPPSILGTFPVGWLFPSGGQSTEASASVSALPMNIQGSFPPRFTGWLSLQSKGLSKTLLQHHSSKTSILQHSAFLTVQLTQLYMTTGKTIALTRRTFAGKVMSLLSNTLSRVVTAFLPRNTHLLLKGYTQQYL